MKETTWHVGRFWIVIFIIPLACLTQRGGGSQTLGLDHALSRQVETLREQVAALKAVGTTTRATGSTERPTSDDTTDGSVINRDSTALDKPTFGEKFKMNLSKLDEILKTLKAMGQQAARLPQTNPRVANTKMALLADISKLQTLVDKATKAHTPEIGDEVLVLFEQGAQAIEKKVAELQKFNTDSSPNLGSDKTRASP